MTAPKPGTASGEAVSSEATSKEAASSEAASKEAADPPPRKLFGAHPIKWVFGLEYMMQGLANPFQGITYQPFFKHLRVDYGLSEAAVQTLFARSYLAWSFKPVLGFFIDAYGRTRTMMIVLLGLAVFGYLFTPLLDQGPGLFFWSMFVLSVALAGTDVAVDRATVIEGAEESKATGRSKAATVGLNQAICWFSIYGTGALAALAGGWVAEHLPFKGMMVLAVVPLVVLLAVWRLPPDRAVPVKVTHSVAQFWSGLNTGPILGVMAFYFIFNFQPAMGALWNNHLIENLHFTQSEVGVSDFASYAGYFLGVLLFTWKGVGWQQRLGLRKIFRIFILVSVAANLTQYLQVEPYFSPVARGLDALLPFLGESGARLLLLCLYSALLAAPLSLIRMSTFSLVGSVVPTAAAGSLFAGFMSVANLGTSFGYQSGSWLYEHGLELGPIRALQSGLFGVPGKAGDELSVSMLLLINSLAFLLSFVCVHVLPDRRATQATEVTEEQHVGPERWHVLDVGLRRALNVAALGAGTALLGSLVFLLGFEPISAVLITFFSVTMLRKFTLDALLRRVQPALA
jgi:MFS family permease